MSDDRSGSFREPDLPGAMGKRYGVIASSSGAARDAGVTSQLQRQLDKSRTREPLKGTFHEFQCHERFTRE